ncbi:redox-sensing transcriptional repressor Rex [Carboxylicivirga mesophila]|uniref:Redox-sensing transcriptional repressor Rex n=2 Tax=Carboxylicivirga TaxID=1628153 RepID=A0A941F6Y7_9BACT|nr:MULTISPECIES: redox-sensing transcriptional repressor Rex [Carboxylicivirga]MBR8536770.1 redox-sensing transcriptional repressor Rex [Carboxylicivirga sediminis]MBS2213533.1 redox-sensing transcriptional repressor Rex [Carboxylicivirga mesophila]
MPLTNRKKNNLVPEPALRRMPCYLAYLKLAQKEGLKHISSTLIARDMGVDPTQVTKDLSYTSIVGKTRVGYEVEPLIEVLEDFLGFTVVDEAYLFGVGSLGKALLHDHGLKQFGLKVVAAFDVDPEVVGKTIEGVPIYHFEELSKMHEGTAKIGILTVPVDKAQDVANKLVEVGIRALWNFTPVRIKVDEDVVVQNTSLYAHLAVMFNRMKAE